MQKLVFFIEQIGKSTYRDKNGSFSGRASTIGNFYMNRFTIDEDAGHEIVNIYGIEELCSLPRIYEENDQIQWSLNHYQIQWDKGMGHFFFNFLQCLIFLTVNCILKFQNLKFLYEQKRGFQ